MGKVRFTTEQIIRKLREAEVMHSQGATISIICKRLEIHEQTFIDGERNMEEFA
ncbi:MAG: transposase [Cyclobacteriaceae bacterium]|nr:transposase [Cyclobacteriaceae bacterium]MCK5207372.1 transposase [Cyclobacteriaceae bacterium]MCK5468570.1 transposase [Cyclobacteriaceae bacterium]